MGSGLTLQPGRGDVRRQRRTAASRPRAGTGCTRQRRGADRLRQRGPLAQRQPCRVLELQRGFLRTTDRFIELGQGNPCRDGITRQQRIHQVAFGLAPQALGCADASQHLQQPGLLAVAQAPAFQLLQPLASRQGLQGCIGFQHALVIALVKQPDADATRIARGIGFRQGRHGGSGQHALLAFIGRERLPECIERLGIAGPARQQLPIGRQSQVVRLIGGQLAPTRELTDRFQHLIPATSLAIARQCRLQRGHLLLAPGRDLADGHQGLLGLVIFEGKLGARHQGRILATPTHGLARPVVTAGIVAQPVGRERSQQCCRRALILAVAFGRMGQHRSRQPLGALETPFEVGQHGLLQ